MATEIEYKFLLKRVPDGIWLVPHAELCQGYLYECDGITSRVRSSSSQVEGDIGFMTVKGPPVSICENPEFEMVIPYEYARIMLDKCPTTLSKIRYNIIIGKHIWEVDEFLGPLKGMWLAEIELDSADEPFEIPDWIGKDVTAISEFKNVNLAKLNKVPDIYYKLMKE